MALATAGKRRVSSGTLACEHYGEAAFHCTSRENASFSAIQKIYIWEIRLLALRCAAAVILFLAKPPNSSGH